MPDQDFEKAFATLAYSELEQKAPGLFPYLIGFQLIDKNDQDNHAVGVFGFKMGNQWYYSPVFWLNGRLRGFDLLYIVSQDIFVPMQESWINYLTNRKPNIMGEYSEKTPQQLGVMAPDFFIFRRSPLTKRAEIPECFRRIPTLPGIPQMLRKMPVKYAHTLLSTIKQNPQFAEAFYTFYDPKELRDSVHEVMGRELFKESAEPKRPKDPGSQPPKHYISADKRDKVQVIYGGENSQGIDTFSPQTTDEKEKFMAGDAVIRDAREDKERSEVYSKPDFERIFQNPTMAGLWRVLTPDGSVKTMFIGFNPKPIGDATTPNIVAVVDLEDKKWLNTSTQSICAKAQLDPSIWVKQFEGLPKPNTIQVGDVGMLVGKNFEASIPFRVLERSKGEGGVVSLKVDPADDVDVGRPGFDLRIMGKYYSEGQPHAPTRIDYKYDNYERGHYIQVIPGKAKLLNTRETMLAGDDWAKFLKLGECRKPPEPKKDNRAISMDPWYEFKREHKLKLGTQLDLDFHLRKLGMEKLAVSYDGHSELNVTLGEKTTGRMSPSHTVGYLVREIGLQEKMARVLVNSAKEHKKVAVLIKRGLFDAPPSSYDPFYKAPVQYPYNEQERFVSNTVSPGEMRQLDYIDEETQRKAVSAAKTGQKDVFDTSVMAGMARANRLDDYIDQFTKDIIIGNDRIGRLLFLYYWHFDKFTDKYGEEDMSDLEDLLREVFKSNGEVILFLKRKSIEPDTEATDSVISLG